VNSTVTDDRNLSANTSTSVSVEAPPPPPPAAPEAQKVNTLNFKKNSARVDNAAKAILDDVALRLQRDADAKAVIVGNVDKGENKRLAGQRATNAKAYLVKEKGIDPSRVETRTGSTAGTTADIWIVPAGATFQGEGTQVVTETAPVAKKKKK
jgi:outer membrane protein OmpA-like peptidoglycan-associated protein